MSDYHMNINGKIKYCDCNNISEYLGIVNFEDKLLITMEDCEDENINIIHQLCKKNKIIIYKEDGTNHGICTIKAIKDKHFNE